MISFFSKKAENIDRQTEIDLLRGFTALILIICHVGLYLGSIDNTALFTFCDISGSEFAAPILMALMGICINYSRHQQPKDLLFRGIFLFVTGYVLNIIRSLLPLILLGNVDEWASIEAFFVIDILQLAGVSFMFFALFKKLKLPPAAILIISIVMVLIDQFIMLPDDVTIENEILIGLINLFCPVTTWSCFPFLTWFFFPAFGLFFGNILTHCVNKKGFYLILLIAGLIGVLAVYGRFYFLYPNYVSYYWGNNFYYMGLKNVFLTCFFIFFALGFWFFTQKILPNIIKNFLIFLSKNLFIFYIISWIIISALIHIEAIIGFKLNTLLSIITMIAITVLCAVLTYLLIILKKKYIMRKK